MASKKALSISLFRTHVKKFINNEQLRQII